MSLIAIGLIAYVITSSETNTSYITASAKFSDVNDLATGAQVEFADIPVGQVTSISLQGNSALVTMTIEKSLNLRSNVVASLERTSILGEEFISLSAPTGSQARSYPVLKSGSTIAKTTVVPGLANVVAAGSEFFGAINAQQLAELVDTSGQAFGGQGQNLRALFDSFSTVITGYSSRSNEITQLIGNLNNLSATLAPDAQQNAQAVSNLAQTTQVLANNSAQFETLLQSLEDISIQGRTLLENYLTDINDELHSIATTAQALQTKQSDLGNLVNWLNGHNTTISKDTVDNFVQVLDSLVVCGLPNGGSDPTQPASTCNQTGGP